VILGVPVEGRFLRASETAVFGESRVERVLVLLVTSTLESGDPSGQREGLEVSVPRPTQRPITPGWVLPRGISPRRGVSEVSASELGAKPACYSRSVSRQRRLDVTVTGAVSFGTSVSDSRQDLCRSGWKSVSSELKN